jgi:hypothetical protein
MKAGKHVLIEKPLCANADEAREIYKVAEQTDRILSTLPYLPLSMYDLTTCAAGWNRQWNASSAIRSVCSATL